MKCLLLIPILFLGACATRPHVYTPPDASKLKASTHRVSVAVDSAHKHSNEAKKKVDEATNLAKEVGKETRALKNVPPTLLQKTNDLESKLDDTKATQTLLEQDLVEADKAKAEVERDKTDYFTASQKLANAATEERSKRIEAEKALSHYRWNSWLYRILGTVGVLLVVGVLVLWFMGKLALKL